jgi:hypothetical protein
MLFAMCLARYVYLVKTSDAGISKKTVDKLFETVDVDGSGALAEDEFVQCIHKLFALLQNSLALDTEDTRGKVGGWLTSMGMAEQQGPPGTEHRQGAVACGWLLAAAGFGAGIRAALCVMHHPSCLHLPGRCPMCWWCLAAAATMRAQGRAPSASQWSGGGWGSCGACWAMLVLLLLLLLGGFCLGAQGQLLGGREPVRPVAVAAQAGKHAAAVECVQGCGPG